VRGNQKRVVLWESMLDDVGMTESLVTGSVVEAHCPYCRKGVTRCGLFVECGTFLRLTLRLKSTVGIVRYLYNITRAPIFVELCTVRNTQAQKRRNCVYILYYSLSSKRAKKQLKRNNQPRWCSSLGNGRCRTRMKVYCYWW
jgi:hypothetical protein